MILEQPGYFENFRLKCFQREKVENISRSTEPSNLRASHHNSRRISAARRRCRCRFRSIQCRRSAVGVRRLPPSQAVGLRVAAAPASADESKTASSSLRPSQPRAHFEYRFLPPASFPVPDPCGGRRSIAGVSSKCCRTLSRRLEMNKLSEDVSSFVNCLSLSLIFIGNPGLCGYWLDSSCQRSHPTERGQLNFLAEYHVAPSNRTPPPTSLSIFTA
ncbi:uncharacterized protein LOC128196209 [Vigna angularis]|uniref:uncharacterized protein LOC128196209 n=1 Tax=Phaseolus angularis TaxID=3914 RepID=UPI0022B3505E|nr:uncharacterized protein LOC128196209 [Vigna angularis]